MRSHLLVPGRPRIGGVDSLLAKTCRTHAGPFTLSDPTQGSAVRLSFLDRQDGFLATLLARLHLPDLASYHHWLAANATSGGTQ